MSSLSPGFLVAAPTLSDPNFRRSVVLLVDHNAQGSLGFVINRASDLALGALADGLSIAADQVRAHGNIMVGGPVAPDTGWIVIDPRGLADLPEGTIRVTDGVAVSTSRVLLERLLRGEVGARHLVVLGYAGWGAGQLDDELVQGAWIPVDLHERVVFDTEFDQRWSAALRSAGIDPARLSVRAPSEA